MIKHAQQNFVVKTVFKELKYFGASLCMQMKANVKEDLSKVNFIAKYSSENLQSTITANMQRVYYSISLMFYFTF